MPIKVRRRQDAPPEEPTIEELRQRYRLGTFERVVLELRELRKQEIVAQMAKNVENRQGTQAANAFKAYAVAEDLKPEDEIQLDELGFRYDVARQEKISPKGLYDLLQSGKVTEDAFLNSVSVLKGEATKYIGAHLLMALEETKIGTDLDIRKRKLDAPAATPVLVRDTPLPKAEKLLRSTDAPPVKLHPVKSGMRRRIIHT